MKIEHNQIKAKQRKVDGTKRSLSEFCVHWIELRAFKIKCVNGKMVTVVQR